jgi:transcription antitermination factor NusG
MESPLFSGYVFCRFDVSKRLPILTTPGVVSVVGIGKQPLPIPDDELAAIKTILESAQYAEPWPYLREGQKVRLERGPLSGVEGIILKKKKSDKWRLVVSVTLLQRSVAAEVERDWVRVIP